MIVLLDHCVNSRVRPLFPPEMVLCLCKERGWDESQNGQLLRAAAAAGIDALLTVDKNLPNQQNKAKLSLAVVLMRVAKSDYASMAVVVPLAIDALRRIHPGEFLEVG